MSSLGIIRGDTNTPPDGAKWTGETVEWGGESHRVFQERRPVYRKVEVQDPTTGQPMYKRGPGGIVLNSVMTRTIVEGYTERRFILVDQGNGQTHKLYEEDYREDARVVTEREREARKRSFLDRLFEKAEAAGGLDALLDALDSDSDEDPDPPPASRKKAA